MMKQMFKSKKGWIIRDFVIVGLLFGIVITMYIFATGSLADNYNNQDMVSPSFSANYNKLQANLDALDTSFAAVKGGSGLNLIGTFNIAFNSVFTVIAMVWNSVTMYSSMGVSMVTDFPFLDSKVATYFFSGIIAMIVVVLIFVWLSSVTRGKI